MYNESPYMVHVYPTKKNPSLNSHSYYMYWHKEKLAYVQFYESLIDMLDSK